MTPDELKKKLRERGHYGLDLSPGDPVDKAALEYIEALEKALAPFARAYYVMGEFATEKWHAQCGSKELLGEDLRRAYLTLEGK
jgi:hypothetical protein